MIDVVCCSPACTHPASSSSLLGAGPSVGPGVLGSLQGSHLVRMAEAHDQVTLSQLGPHWGTQCHGNTSQYQDRKNIHTVSLQHFLFQTLGHDLTFKK